MVLDAAVETTDANLGERSSVEAAPNLGSPVVRGRATRSALDLHRAPSFTRPWMDRRCAREGRNVLGFFLTGQFPPPEQGELGRQPHEVRPERRRSRQVAVHDIVATSGALVPHRRVVPHTMPYTSPFFDPVVRGLHFEERPWPGTAGALKLLAYANLSALRASAPPGHPRPLFQPGAAPVRGFLRPDGEADEAREAKHFLFSYGPPHALSRRRLRDGWRREAKVRKLLLVCVGVWAAGLYHQQPHSYHTRSLVRYLVRERSSIQEAAPT